MFSESTTQRRKKGMKIQQPLTWNITIHLMLISYWILPTFLILKKNSKCHQKYHYLTDTWIHLKKKLTVYFNKFASIFIFRPAQWFSVTTRTSCLHQQGLPATVSTCNNLLDAATHTVSMMSLKAGCPNVWINNTESELTNEGHSHIWETAIFSNIKKEALNALNLQSHCNLMNTISWNVKKSE